MATLALAQIPFLTQNGLVSQPWLQYLLNQHDTVALSTALNITSIAGTGNAITGALPVDMIAFTTGQLVTFTAVNSNSGAVTLSVNGLAAVNLKKDSAAGPVALVTGDIVALNTYMFRYDGTQLVSISTLGGSVTATGTLTAGQLIMGNGGNDITVASGIGTTTTVLHGNAGGAPTFGAVSLTADISGILGITNGGTGSNQFQVAISTPFVYDSGISNAYYAFASFKFSDTYNGAGGFVNGLTIEQRITGGAQVQGRQTIMGLCYQTAATSAAASAANFTGVVGESTSTSGDGGSAGTPKGAYFGLNGIASASSSAQYVELVSGGEFNTFVYAHGTPNTRARRHNGINIAPNVHTERGYVVDAGINIYEQTGASGTFRHGILFGCVGAATSTFAQGTDPGAATPGTGSAVIGAYNDGAGGTQNVNYVFDLRLFNASVSLLEGNNIRITDGTIGGGGGTLSAVTATTFNGTLNGAAPAGSLSGATLAAGVTSSSLTTVGKLVALDVDVTTTAEFKAGSNNAFTVDSAGNINVGCSLGTGAVYVQNQAGISTTVTTGSLVGKTMTFAGGILIGFA